MRTVVVLSGLLLLANDAHGSSWLPWNWRSSTQSSTQQLSVESAPSSTSAQVVAEIPKIEQIFEPPKQSEPTSGWSVWNYLWWPSTKPTTNVDPNIHSNFVVIEDQSPSSEEEDMISSEETSQEEQTMDTKIYTGGSRVKADRPLVTFQKAVPLSNYPDYNDYQGALAPKPSTIMISEDEELLIKRLERSLKSSSFLPLQINDVPSSMVTKIQRLASLYEATCEVKQKDEVADIEIVKRNIQNDPFPNTQPEEDPLTELKGLSDLTLSPKENRREIRKSSTHGHQKIRHTGRRHSTRPKGDDYLARMRQKNIYNRKRVFRKNKRNLEKARIQKEVEDEVLEKQLSNEQESETVGDRMNEAWGEYLNYSESNYDSSTYNDTEDW